MRYRQLFLVFSLGLLGGLAGAWIFSYQQQPAEGLTLVRNNSQERPTYEDAAGTQFGGPGGELPANFREAAGQSTRSVVFIKTYADKQQGRGTWMDRFFYGDTPSRQRDTALGSGSGVIFTADGYVVTNNHVIEGADKIEVVHQKRTYQAQLVGTDPSTDLALLKIEAEGMPAIRVASSREVQVGDWVLAVGNPFNLATTVTAGIVSAKGRKINILKDIFPIESFIQTDAAINPGNSGGALVNTHGDLVGINTAILSRTGSYAGYGFAVPSDIVAKVVNDLRRYGQVQKAFVGAEIAEVDERIARQLGLSDLSGVVVRSLEQGGAAAKAGLQPGDVIVEIDNFPVRTEADYDEQLSYHVPGDQLAVKALRNGSSQEFRLTLTNNQGTTGISKRELYNADRIGAQLEALPKLERSRLQLESGIRVTEVLKGGLVQRMGLRKGDIIVSINRYPLELPKDFSTILERISGRVIIEVLDTEGQRQYYSYYF